MANIKIGSKTFEDVERIKLPLADGSGQAQFGSGSNPENIEWHQCPELARNFVANVTYDPDDYSVSHIADYAPSTPVVSNYKPIGKTVGDKTFYNETPNTETLFRIDGAYGTVKPLDHVRYINTPSAPNVRDLGGWSCDGGTVKYGLLYRGGEPSATDRTVLVDELGIRHDLNLRGSTEATWNASPLGEDIYFTKAAMYNWYTATVNDAWRTNLRCVFDAVTHNEPVYFHCAAGADRTGTLACVLEGLLGMSQSDIDKDYELTCFFTGTYNDDATRARSEKDWKELISSINTYNGSSFRDKCVSFVVSLGFTANEINAYRKAMIDGEPDMVVPNIAAYSVTNVLSNITTSNNAEIVSKYQPYETSITADDGYVISDICIVMNGNDITNSVFTGKQKNLLRYVTKILLNCKIDNVNTKIIDGQGYVANLTADDGYVIDDESLMITIGGVDAMKYYSEGKIAIPNVNGDIVITATAIASAPDYTNVFDSTNLLLNNKYNSSNQVVEAKGYVICETLFKIPTSDTGTGTATMRIKNPPSTMHTTNTAFLHYRSQEGNFAGGGTASISFARRSDGVLEGDFNLLKPKYGEYACLSLRINNDDSVVTQSDVAKIVVTINEEI